MVLGGYCVLPAPCGGGTPRVQSIHQALNQFRGTASDVSGPTSPQWQENMATARAIDTIHSTNDRVANLTDPYRTTALARWERIFGITPPPNATDYARRQALAAAWLRIGTVPTRQLMIDQLTAALGQVFVQLVDIPYTIAQNSPGTSTNPWTSTTAHVLVQVQTPSGWTEQMFQAAVAKAKPIMDWALPAHCTWNWYRDGAGHNAGQFWPDVHAGVFCNDPIVCDNEILDR